MDFDITLVRKLSTQTLATFYKVLEADGSTSIPNELKKNINPYEGDVAINS